MILAYARQCGHQVPGGTTPVEEPEGEFIKTRMPALISLRNHLHGRDHHL
jgi:hypothetical protein